MIKKSNILVLLFCCSLGLLSGQNKWNFSPSVIIGYSGEKSNHESSSGDSQSGYYYSLDEKKLLPTIGAGFNAERLLGRRFGINLGVRYLYNQLFEQNKYNYSTPAGLRGSYYEYQKNLVTHQIQAPLQLHFYMGKPGGIRPYIGIGGQATYLVSAVDYSENLSAYTDEVYHDTWVQKHDLKNEWNGFSRFNIAMNYAIGIELNRISIEFNRTQNTFKKNSYGNAYYDCFCYYVELPEERIQATTMSIKYKL